MTYISPKWNDPYGVALASLSADDINELMAVSVANITEGSSFIQPDIFEKIAKPLIAAQNGLFHAVNTNTLTTASIQTQSLEVNGISIHDLILATVKANQASQSGSMTSLPETATASAEPTTSIASNNPNNIVMTIQMAFTNTVEFLKAVTFRDIITFASRAIFRTGFSSDGVAEFTGTVRFPSNMAGSVTIPKYSQAVDITFPAPFASPPIITLTPLLSEATDSAFMQEAAGAAVTNVTVRGFTIVLPYISIREYRYNYLAVLAQDAARLMGIPTNPTILGQATGSGVIDLSNILSQPQASASATPTPTAQDNQNAATSSGQAP